MFFTVFHHFCLFLSSPHLPMFFTISVSSCPALTYPCFSLTHVFHCFSPFLSLPVQPSLTHVFHHFCLFLSSPHLPMFFTDPCFSLFFTISVSTCPALTYPCFSPFLSLPVQPSLTHVFHHFCLYLSSAHLPMFFTVFHHFCLFLSSPHLPMFFTISRDVSTLEAGVAPPDQRGSNPPPHRPVGPWAPCCKPCNRPAALSLWNPLTDCPDCTTCGTANFLGWGKGVGVGLIVSGDQRKHESSVYCVGRPVQIEPTSP